jgi:hypothetical protein
MSDSASVCSSHSATSVSLSKMECPFCVKDLQVRAMFNHIRKSHPDELLKNTTRRWLEDAENGQPLRVYWTLKDDFDEEHVTSLYVCLSTNKTFISLQKATDHFKKDKAALKDHNKQLKQLKKDHSKYRKEKAKASPKTPETPLSLALRSNDPELARAIWRALLNTVTTLECCRMLCRRSLFTSETKVYLYDAKLGLFEEVGYAALCDIHDALLTKFQVFKAAKCLDVKPLWALFWEMEDFWRRSYRESVDGLSETLRSLHPSFNHGINGDESVFYGIATEEMKGVPF